MKKLSKMIFCAVTIIVLCAYPAIQAFAAREDPTVYVFSDKVTIGMTNVIVFTKSSTFTAPTRRLTATCGALTVTKLTTGDILYIKVNPVAAVATATYTDQIVLDDEHPTYEFGAFMPSQLQAVSDSSSDLDYVALCYGSNG